MSPVVWSRPASSTLPSWGAQVRGVRTGWLLEWGITYAVGQQQFYPHLVDGSYRDAASRLASVEFTALGGTVQSLLDVNRTSSPSAHSVG